MWALRALLFEVLAWSWRGAEADGERAKGPRWSQGGVRGSSKLFLAQLAKSSGHPLPQYCLNEGTSALVPGTIVKLHSLSDVGPALYIVALRFYEADFVDNKFYGPKVPAVLAAELGSYTSA